MGGRGNVIPHYDTILHSSHIVHTIYNINDVEKNMNYNQLL